MRKNRRIGKKVRETRLKREIRERAGVKRNKVVNKKK